MNSLANLVLIFIIFCSCNNKKSIDNSNNNTATNSPNQLNRDTTIIPFFSSGNYNDISLAYDSVKHNVSGVYQYYDNWNEKDKEYLNVNVFYFFGADANSSKVNIDGSWPISKQQFRGQLNFLQNNDKGIIKINLNEQPLGYNDVDFTQKEGVMMTLQESKKWIQIRIVKSPIVKLFDQPDSSKSRKGFLVKYDIVKVISKNINGWCNIEYNPKNDNTKSSFYWLREESLYDIDPAKW